MYFEDGTWGSDVARGATFFPDWIAVGSTANVVQISGIDYSKNTLMLAAPISGATRLPSGSSRSDGEVVLSGAGPDFGASEFGGGAPLPPANPRIIR